MLVEYAQLLSTAVKLKKPNAEGLYRISYKNHPCAKWVRESKDNFLWLIDLTHELQKEWRFRFNHPNTKKHKSWEMITTLPLPKLPSIGITPFAQAMPEQYKHKSAIVAYREYYKNDKPHLANWGKRGEPYWW